MAFACRVERDSLSPDGVRLTTFVITYPRIIHCELLTHRVFSRNSASSRAIPVQAQIRAVEEGPYIPTVWGANQKGMQAGGEVDNPELCRSAWLGALKSAVTRAQTLADQGVHKQHVNRLLEPFSWITTIISGTAWGNFFALRCHEDAQPEFQTIACMMRDALAASTPRQLAYGQWHLPLVRDDEMGAFDDSLKRISAGRCCRVSYLTHDGRRAPHEDIALCERLIAAVPKHASPLEHVATPVTPGTKTRCNYHGWRQFRHEIQDESVPG